MEKPARGASTSPAAVVDPPHGRIVVALDAGVEDGHEASMPRWRRPSLMAARKAVPGTSLAADHAQRLRFGPASGDGAETPIHAIRYRMVRLTDRPDEILGVEIDRLDQGDEVEVLERSSGYVRVRTPLGQEGWVHRTTIGERIGDQTDQSTPTGSRDGREAVVDLAAIFGDEGPGRAAMADLELEMNPAAQLLRERLGG